MHLATKSCTCKQRSEATELGPHGPAAGYIAKDFNQISIRREGGSVIAGSVPCNSCPTQGAKVLRCVGF